MDSIKSIAHQAKLRLKNNFWENCKTDMAAGETQAKNLVLNQRKVKKYIGAKVMRRIRGG